jgi:hypothetical protein
MCGQNRERLAAAEPNPVGFHRRLEVLPGPQAQVDWGDEARSRARPGRCTPTASA